jgi:hypothetical protein
MSTIAPLVPVWRISVNKKQRNHCSMQMAATCNMCNAVPLHRKASYDGLDRSILVAQATQAKAPG